MDESDAEITVFDRCDVVPKPLVITAIQIFLSVFLSALLMQCNKCRRDGCYNDDDACKKFRFSILVLLAMLSWLGTVAFTVKSAIDNELQLDSGWDRYACLSHRLINSSSATTFGIWFAAVVNGRGHQMLTEGSEAFFAFVAALGILCMLPAGVTHVWRVLFCTPGRSLVLCLRSFCSNSFSWSSFAVLLTSCSRRGCRSKSPREWTAGECCFMAEGKSTCSSCFS